MPRLVVRRAKPKTLMAGAMVLVLMVTGPAAALPPTELPVPAPTLGVEEFDVYLVGVTDWCYSNLHGLGPICERLQPSVFRGSVTCLWDGSEWDCGDVLGLLVSSGGTVQCNGDDNSGSATGHDLGYVGDCGFPFFLPATAVCGGGFFFAGEQGLGRTLSVGGTLNGACVWTGPL